MLPHRSDCVVIGGGQAALSASYYLHKFGLSDHHLIVDHAPRPGGAWQFRWPTLTLAGANHVHDLPGYGLVEALGIDCDAFPASTAVTDYYAQYEQKFGITVHRPVHAHTVSRVPDAATGDAYAVNLRTPDGDTTVTTPTIINATGTWDRPFIPHVRGHFEGRQLHTHDYHDPHDFDGARVLVVGAGISAVQLLIEIGRSATNVTTYWCSRREPTFTDTPFTSEQGRAAVSRVEDRVRQGLPPGSVVSVTGLHRTPAIAAAQRDGLMRWRPMFTELVPDGVKFGDGSTLDLDAILWCTGFRSSLDHLAPLHLHSPGGGITMTGRLATVVANEPEIQLLGYGPSASTIGANRAGREAARVVAESLRWQGRP